MADTKISAMPSATTCIAADVIAIVQTGVNRKIDRPTYLSAQPSEDIAFLGGSTEVGVDGGGDAFVNLQVGAQYDINDGTHHFFKVGAAGTIDITTAPGSPLSINCSGGQITMGALGDIGLQPAAGQVLHLAYIPGTSGDWVGPAPTDVWTALDRIAANIVTITGLPIP